MNRENNVQALDVRSLFPYFSQQPRAVYLDSAATGLKPQSVIDALVNYYSYYSVNIHRSIYTMGQHASSLYEEARSTAEEFFHSEGKYVTLFTAGATQGLNFTAWWIDNFLKEGDEILTSELEHHSSLIPWQQVAKNKNLLLSFIPLTPEGVMETEAIDRSITDKTRVIVSTAMSNITGYSPPLNYLSRRAKECGAFFILDGAQAAAHSSIDLSKLDCDFFSCSLHKMYGPTGLGFLLVKKEHLERMPPLIVGGGMVDVVERNTSSWATIPERFEGGTSHIAGAIASKPALDFIDSYGADVFENYEHLLIKEFVDAITSIPTVRILGEENAKSSICSFIVKGAHSHDVGTFLNSKNIAVRTGHHCAQPLLRHFGCHESVRVSVAPYNTKSDILECAKALDETISILT